MAKLIELMGPPGVGKSTILHNLRGKLSDINDFYGYRDRVALKYIKSNHDFYDEMKKYTGLDKEFYSKRFTNACNLYNFIVHNKKNQYVITEDRVMLRMILTMVRPRLAEESDDDLIVSFLRNPDRDKVKNFLKSFPNTHMVFNLKANEKDIEKRICNRDAGGRFFNYLPIEERWVAIKNIMDYIDILSDIMKEMGVIVHYLDTSLPFEKNVMIMKEILLENIKWIGKSPTSGI